jgi:heat shock protein HslJ
MITITPVARLGTIAATGLALLSLFLGSLAFGQPQSASPLANTSWQLIEMRGISGLVQRPDNPESYLLRFRLENRSAITADCNEAGATWNHEGETLTLTRLVTTRKLCEPPSLFNFYIMNLQNTRRLRLEEDRLVLITENDMAELIFEPYVFRPTF